MVLGTFTLLATAAIMSILVILALQMLKESSGQTTAKVAAVLQAIVFISVGWLLSTYASASLRDLSIRYLGAVFGLSLFAVIFAATASVATMIYLSHLTVDSKVEVLGTDHSNFLIGSSTALGLSFTLQLIFVITYFIFARASGLGAVSLHSFEDDQRSPAFEVKSIRHSPTTPDLHQVREVTSRDSRSPPPSIGGRPKIEITTTIRVSLSNAIRPVTSKTQLISTKERKRPESQDSSAYRTSGDDSFDSWDTSSVDTNNRQAVLEASSPPHAKTHFLETIPGSPTASREPSPNNSMPFEPPRIRTRSRSYSPVPSRRELPSLTQQPSASELHIHPLFRSDSPTPPPLATPGTVVVASPNAGQVIVHRQSLRTLNQMRSNTAPASPSPLGIQTSGDFRRPRDDQGSLRSLKDLTEEPATTERTMTPPIPDWILSAGTRSSIIAHNNRKTRGEDEMK